MLATSFSNLSWRPVLAVLFGAFLYVICLPMATQVRHPIIHQTTIFSFSHLIHSQFLFSTFKYSEQGLVRRRNREIHGLHHTAGRYSTRLSGHRL
jgi:hypothetical protein